MLKKITAFIITVAIVFPGAESKAELCPGAVSAVLIETGANTVLYEKNAHKKLPMASTTKIMTAICAIEKGDIDKTVETDIRAYGIEGSSIYLKKGERITLRSLIYGLMLHSGNDAAVAIACEISGSPESFSELMNSTAKKIGAVNTSFENPNGLDGKNHYTTAYDLALITSYALKNPCFAEIVSTYKATIKNDEGMERQLKNHNKLLTMYNGCTGVKTGFTRKSGRCLVSSAKRDNIELVAVTLNDGDDWNDHTAMLNYGFENTKARCIFKKGDYLRTVKVKKGAKKTAGIICKDDVYITSIKGRDPEINLEYNIPPELTAPLYRGSCAGEVIVRADNKAVTKAEAIISENINSESGFEIWEKFLIVISFWMDFPGKGNVYPPQ